MTSTEVKPASKLRGADRFQAADFSIARYVAKVPSGTTLEEVLHPQYFENHLDRIRSGMEITVLSDDYELDVRLRVLSVTKSTASMRVLDVYHEEAQDTASGDEGEDNVVVTFAGAHHKWRIMHGKTIVETGFASKDDALAAKGAYLAKINT